ncbi:MAG: DUF4190 domain-containing protein [Phycisphaerae bacterium]
MPEKPMPTESPQRPDTQSADRKNAPGVVAAFVTGLLSLTCLVGLLLGPVSIILSLGAKKKIQESPELYKGKGLAIAGLLFGIAGLLLSIVFLLAQSYGMMSFWQG